MDRILDKEIAYMKKSNEEDRKWIKEFEREDKLLNREIERVR